MKRNLFVLFFLMLPCLTPWGNTKYAAFSPKGLKEGSPAPEISMTDPNGETISLSSYRGKIVLVDFWASWCHPCREVSDKVVALYNKYKDRKFEHGNGFEILSVSLDVNQNDWVQAIDDDKLSWKGHVCDFARWRSQAVSDYYVSFIPSGTLVDGDGKVIATNLDYRMISYYLKAMVKRRRN